MNLPYVVPRVIRHFLPDRVTRFLLLRSLIIKPGLETADPRAAVLRYEEVLQARGDTLGGKRVLVFGYGGRFDVGVGLLEAGASFVVLCDKYAAPDDPHNRRLAKAYGQYIQIVDGYPRPAKDRMLLLEEDVRDVGPSGAVPPVDLVISNSVYEHVQDVPGSTAALAHLTNPHGLHIHFVDLRDHFFKYPFEMLTFSAAAWQSWLNPTSNHNRLRIRDYRRIFGEFFGDVEIHILAQDSQTFTNVIKRIRPEFLSGNLQEDSATLIKIVAALPSG